MPLPDPRTAAIAGAAASLAAITSDRTALATGIGMAAHAGPNGELAAIADALANRLGVTHPDPRAHVAERDARRLAETIGLALLAAVSPHFTDRERSQLAVRALDALDATEVQSLGWITNQIITNLRKDIY